MGTQTVASQGSSRGRHSQFHSPARQTSIYSLTLNEVQSHLDEPLHSMNLDELLKNVLPAGMNQAFDIDRASASQYPFGLQGQGSITMSRAMNKKTVDEVWRDIQQKKRGEERSSGSARQPTLGEMTLENFLVMAGLVAEAPDKRCNQVGSGHGFVHGAHQLQQYYQHQAQPVGVGAGHILDGTCQEGQVMTTPSPITGTLFDTQAPGRKRVVEEKSVERRQKRMIKNRESAARSRARKLAYMNELENKVSHLEEENERLKKQKQSENMLYCVPPPEPKHRIRRASSVPF